MILLFSNKILHFFRTINWSEEDLPSQKLPESQVRPVDLDDCDVDVKYFLKMFGNNNVELLTIQSNIQREKEAIERNRNIPAISEKEVRQCLGILMYMSIVHLPNIRLYWRATLRNEMVAGVMTRDRFEQIVSCFHLSDNNLQPARDSPVFDRLYKIREFITNLASNFKRHAEVEQVSSVDEQMIPFKGQLWLKVFMKDKPVKRGVKVWALAGKSGYIHRFYLSGDILVGLEAEEVEDLDPSIGLSGQVVLYLVQKPQQPEPGFQVFFDNYFASPALLLHLKNLGIPAACTLRKDRMEHCPLKSEKELKREGRGSMDCRTSSERILVLKWYDNKEVCVGSNPYSANPVSTDRRWDKKDKAYVSLTRPAVIGAYNEGMGAVDRCDQLLAFYRIVTKSRKWYKRILYHFVDVSIVNAFIMRRAITGAKNLPLFEFKLDVATALMYGENFVELLTRSAAVLREVVPRAANGDPVAGPSPTDAVRLDGMNHWPEQAAKVPRCCRVMFCKLRSTYWCSKCNVYLCLKGKNNCFVNYHLHQ